MEQTGQFIRSKGEIMQQYRSDQHQPLPAAWVDKIFLKLKANYGTRFVFAYRSGVNDEHGQDTGIIGAKAEYAQRLAAFKSSPAAIRYALEHLPPVMPSLHEFAQLCRQGERLAAGQASIEPQLTEQQQRERREHAQQFIAQCYAALGMRCRQRNISASE
jgi:hypothetical protein